LLFTVTAKHIEVPEAVKKHVKEKTSKLPRYYNGINQVEVVIDGGPKDNVNVEIIARGEHNKVFVVNETDSDAYRCIDSAVRKLEEQLRRKKTRERNNKHTSV